ncbi:hypothetical protein PTKIN_Ptkin12aG0068800 [Pterospermum kingtungense]
MSLALVYLVRDVNKLEETCYILWWLWNNRNPTFHDRRCLTPAALVAIAARYEEFRVLTCESSVRATSSSRRWCAPEVRKLKINVDASFVYGSRDNKSGVVVQDDGGKVLCCVIVRHEVAVSPLHAELTAILDGLILP